MENEMVDPVSGNEVPLGGTAEGVRDDVPAQLSEGEYVLPTHVVNFYGEEIIEDLIKNAEDRMREMGEEIPVDPEAVPAEKAGMEEEIMEEDDGSREQLLAFEDEAADALGYYMGGLVVSRKSFASGGKVTKDDLDRDVEPFNRDDWTILGSSYFDQDSGDLMAGDRVSVETYKNAAGKTRQVTFVDGEPLTSIPEGFYPLGEVPKDSATRQVNETNEREAAKESEFGNFFGSAADEVTSDEEGPSLRKNQGFGAWGGKNPYSLGADELLAAAEKSAGTSGIMNFVGKAGSAISPVVGFAAMGLKANSVSNLRATQLVAEAQGYTDVANQIGEMVDRVGGDNNLMDWVASGENKAERFKAAWDAQQSPTGGSNPTSSTSSASASPSGGSSWDDELSGSGGDDFISGGDSGSNFSSGASYSNETSTPTKTEESVSYGSTTSGSSDGPTQSYQNETDKQVSDRVSSQGESLSYGNTVDSNTDDDDDDPGQYSAEKSFGFAKGGLVKKRKATRK